MSDRDRFEDEGLRRLERGEPLGDEFAGTEELQRSYDRLKRALAEAAPESDVDEDWKRRVFAEIERGERLARRRRVLAVAAPLAAAAVLIVTLWIPPKAWFGFLSLSSAPAAELRVTVQASDGVPRRGEDLHPGARLTLDATTGDAAHAELRVYLNDTTLVLRCSEELPCRRRGQRLSAALELERIGEYHPVLIVSDVPIPEPIPSLDGDAAAAMASGARVETSPPLRVR